MINVECVLCSTQFDSLEKRCPQCLGDDRTAKLVKMEKAASVLISAKDDMHKAVDQIEDGLRDLYAMRAKLVKALQIFTILFSL